MDAVTLSNLYGAINSAEKDAHGLALLDMARHLRWDHGMSRRKVALRLGVRERWVRDNVDKYPPASGRTVK